MDGLKKKKKLTVLYHREDKWWILENKAFRTPKKNGLSDYASVCVWFCCVIGKNKKTTTAQKVVPWWYLSNNNMYVSVCGEKRFLIIKDYF